MRVKPEAKQNDTCLYHGVAPDGARYRPSRRGQLNTLRKGKPKIHRRYTPMYSLPAPNGIARRVFAGIMKHDWNRNPALVALRQKGYTPYSRQFDPDFKPKPRRLGVRSESREALTALHFALAANCDYSPDSEYPFEVTVPFEEVARQMGVLHRYQNGRTACDTAYHALRVTEEMKEVIVVRGWDQDTRQHKPLRIFLSLDFFKSKGIRTDELKVLLSRFQAWARKKGLTQSLKQRNERHLLRLERLNLGIEKLHSLKKLLKRIKWQITSPELLDEKHKAMATLENAISDKEKVVQLRDAMSAKSRWFAWVNSGAQPLFVIKKMEAEISLNHPQLINNNEEQYYRLLLERAGI
ncbi:hypothetical protein ACQUXI_004107 [Cronobacter turicensis]|nr:hypothetical protein [Cronobacter dublinensis]ELY4410056.1 hypothetical protein [Cronobacter dublinensis]ELY4487597.1 hypothetical protein [Cronobacter dublinensis]